MTDAPVARPQPRRGPAGPRPAAARACTANGGSPAAVAVPARGQRRPGDCTATATSGDDVARRAGGRGGRLDDLRHRRRAAATPTSSWGRRGRRTGPSRSRARARRRSGRSPSAPTTSSSRASPPSAATGIALSGTGLVVRGNQVERADLDGISCEDLCADAVIEDNTVVGADGSGILVMGDRSLVRGNAVSGSVRREASDADGIRFFGADLRDRREHRLRHQGRRLSGGDRAAHRLLPDLRQQPAAHRGRRHRRQRLPQRRRASA